jgi:hypothetical protein
MGRAGRHHADLHPGFEHAVFDADQGDDTEIGIVPAIDQQRLEGRFGIAFGRRQALDQSFQQALDIDAGLG